MNKNTPSVTAFNAPHIGGAVTQVTEGGCIEGGCVEACLSTTYFGSVSWYAQLARATSPVYIEAHENYVKQTARTRCRIATANGVQTLSVPVNATPADGGGKCPIREVRITDHANWRHQHWNALKSAYGESPFFDYYADDIAPFFEKKWEFLFDFNLEIIHKMCELLDIHPDIRLTEAFQGARVAKRGDSARVVREGDLARVAREEGSARADGSLMECTELKPYYQVFQKRHGFIEDLSVLDLLFNMGNEAVLYL